MEEKYKAVFLGNSERIEHVYGGGRCEQVLELCDFLPGIIESGEFKNRKGELSDVEIIFSTWGMPALTEAQIAAMPKLKAVFYAAGSVQNFARPFLKSGVKVFSAWAANAVPVAEFSLACILFGLKQAYPCIRDNIIEGRNFDRSPILGCYDTTVGLISLGMIGRKVAEFLRNFQVKTVAYDPFVRNEIFKEYNIQKVELNELFSISDVVSLHTPNLESTKGMITGDHFRMMKKRSTFINTARGAVIKQDEMIEALRERPDISAHLDVVTKGAEDELINLPNAYLTPHIAGSMGNECWRMADFMIEEFKLFQNNKLTKYEVSEEMLKTMA
jgi:phosphoglycerate dehydrogenase-like enzyme